MVCVGEGGKQLTGDAREPLPVRPGTPARHDAEYTRAGVANLFMAFEPLAGVRRVEAAGRKTSVDFARLLRALSDQHYPRAGRVVLACDNLSTHTPAALYEAFEPPGARRLAERSGSSGTTRRGTGRG